MVRGLGSQSLRKEFHVRIELRTPNFHWNIHARSPLKCLCSAGPMRSDLSQCQRLPIPQFRLNFALLRAGDGAACVEFGAITPGGRVSSESLASSPASLGKQEPSTKCGNRAGGWLAIGERPLDGPHKAAQVAQECLFPSNPLRLAFAAVVCHEMTVPPKTVQCSS